jgi:hypothetical protein
MATKKTSLRAVKPDEKPPARKRTARKTVSRAAEGGDRRELLVAMRARLAKAVEDVNTPARDLAALSRRLLEVANEIESIDSASADDEIGKAAATPDDEWDASAI